MKGIKLSQATRVWLLAAGCLFLAACCGNVKPTVKIGLSAPFEGRHRDLGYEVLYAVQLAVRERNDEGGVGSRYLVEMVALNDFNEPREAVAQAYEMYTDPDVLAVLGGWSPQAAAAAQPVYGQLGLAFLSPPASWSSMDFPSTEPFDEQFARRYETLSGGALPGPVAAWAYIEAHRLLDVIDAALRTGMQPARSQVGNLLRSD
jgi:ABC-type branched-subunit amino acid transport system substrate-binding protein